MITITCNSHFLAEKKYTCKVLFSEILEQEYTFVINNDVEDYRITLPNNKTFIIKDAFFHKYTDSYLHKAAIPEYVPVTDFFSHKNVPVLYGNPKIQKSVCEVDIIASSFFMLTRWEEIVCEEYDSLGRFKGTAALAYKFNFIKTPVVNVYAAIIQDIALELGFVISYKREFTKTLTHDVDSFFKWNSITERCKTVIGDVLKRLSVSSAFKNIGLIYKKADPYDTFQELIELSKQKGEKSVFYFLYTPENEKAILSKKGTEVCNKIERAKSSIGMHFNHFKMQDVNNMRTHSKFFETVFRKTIDISRQHFLQFQYPETLYALEACNIKEDSSLYYRDSIGFRTGCCIKHSLFDPVLSEEMQIKELPLVCMDVSLLDYVKPELAKKEVLDLLEITKKYNGNFVCLWHNSSFDYFVWKDHIHLYELICKF